MNRLQCPPNSALPRNSHVRFWPSRGRVKCGFADIRWEKRRKTARHTTGDEPMRPIHPIDFEN